MYCPGELDQRITFITDTSVSDGQGGQVLTPVNVAEVFAKVKPDNGKEFKESDRVDATANYTFITHYRDDITESMRILWEGNEYNIRYIPKRGSRAIYSEYKAERGVAQ